VQLVEAAGEETPAVLGKARFADVPCHGVLMYLDDPVPMVAALAELVDDGGVVSVAAKNVKLLAVRLALEGNWRQALGPC
jgi:S-adenosylmethionine-dependent methyltransferase